MVSSINSNVNQVQLLRATQAFKKAIGSSSKVNSFIKENEISEIKDSVSISLKEQDFTGNISRQDKMSSVQNKELMSEIKQYADKYGKYDLNDEDINYALKYGRSILINQVV